MPHKTEQESFWAGEFGDGYISRNESPSLFASNVAFWSKVLASVGKLESALELGANIGLNLKALNILFPQVNLEGVEINKQAADKLAAWGKAKVFNGSILDYPLKQQFELVFTKGVLIHLEPKSLDSIYDLMMRASSRFICIAEYYNPTLVEIPYRGHAGKLFKNDFAGEMLRRYPSLKLLDYGFVYRNDPTFPQDDITWFLLEKR